MNDDQAKATAPESAAPKDAGDDRGDGAEGQRGITRLLRELYYARSPRAIRFRYGLLIFDLVTIIYVVGLSFVPNYPWVDLIDIPFGLLILADWAARLIISRSPIREAFQPLALLDLIVAVSLLAPLLDQNLAFLRVLRTLRLFRSYQIVGRLRQDSPYFQRNQEVVLSTVNLAVFILMMTALVYTTQEAVNKEINDYADALYFTVTTLTTTGFGDITLSGTTGRMLSVLIMIFGVSLFIRLAQTVFRPAKLHYDCPSCGLSRHDPDAVHCKHCGEVIKIPTEGLD